MRTSSILRLTVLTPAFATLPPGPIKADDVYDRIRGTMTHASAAVIGGAKVTATNVDTGISRTVQSGSDGSYEFLQLAAPATYTVTGDPEYHHQVRDKPVPRRWFRILPGHKPQHAELFPPGWHRLPPEPIRRHHRRPDSERQGLLLLFLPGHPESEPGRARAARPSCSRKINATGPSRTWRHRQALPRFHWWVKSAPPFPPGRRTPRSSPLVTSRRRISTPSPPIC